MPKNPFSEDKKTATTKSYHKRRVFAVLGIFTAAFIIRYATGMWTSGWTVITIILALIAGTVDMAVNELRYLNRKKVTSPHTSWSWNSDDEYSTENFEIYEVGGINYKGIGKHGGEGTIVVPKELADETEDGVRIYGRPHSVSFASLDREVRDTIDDQGCNEPYYYTVEGEFPAMAKLTQTLDREKIDKETEEEIKNLLQRVVDLKERKNALWEDKNDRISDLESRIQDELRDLESIADAGKSITGRDWKQKAKDIFSKSEERERRR